MLEIFEDRLLLASTGLLQGVVTQSATSQPLPNATILLHKLDTPPIPDQNATTDANGVWSFTGLPSGQYRITETPPAGFANDTSNANSPLTPILAQTPQSFDVQIGDFSNLTANYVSRNTVLLETNANGDVGTSQVGQFNFTVTEPDISYTTPLFPSFCVDYFRDVHLGETNLPYQAESLAAALQADSHVVNPQNAGAIAYLYNTIGSKYLTNPVTATEAAGFQLAIWELEYEHNPAPYNVLDGTFVVQGLNASSPEVIAAQNFLTQATAQPHPDQLAIYLSGLPITGRPNGSQGVIAPMSFDFTNVATAGPTISTTPNHTSITLNEGATPILTDTADLRGGNNPTGTITFKLVFNGNTVDTETVPVNGNGSYITPTGYTLPTTGGVTGTYQWNATYSGDANNPSVSDNGSTDEQVLIIGASPLIATTPNPPSVVLGAGPVTLFDTAVLSAGYNPTGTITFTLKLNGNVVDTETATVNGNGAYTTPTGYALPTTGTVTGTYQWDATYGGDSNNNSVSETGNASEQVLIPHASSLIATTPDPTSVNLGTTPVVLKDTATLSSTYHPTGTITFKLSFNGTVLDTETATVNGSGSYTTPTGYTLAPGAADGIYQWDASYSGDGNNAAVSEIGSATEQVAVNRVLPGTVPLSGLVFCDTNNNGVFDAGDDGINGVTIMLTGTNSDGGQVSLTTTTQSINGQDGSYVFPNVNSGTYTVTETPPAGYLDGIVSVGTAGGTVVGRSVENIQVTTTAASGYNFAQLKLTDLSGTVYCDTDFNGVFNPGTDPLVPGATVVLTGTNDLGQSVNMTLTTDASGVYDFTGLRLGTYTINVTPPAGFLPFKSNPGNLGGTAGTSQISSISLLFCDMGTDYNFGLVQAAKLSGLVFCDANLNGTQDAGEEGVPGVSIRLTGTDVTGASVNIVQATASDGTYHFSNLYPSLSPNGYTVTETLPAGYTQGTNSLGTVDGKPVGTVGTNSFTGVVLGKGSVGINYNFAVLGPSSLSGFVYFDVFHNGKLDLNDYGIAHVKVDLEGTNNLGQSVAMTTFTDENGFYDFAGLRPGTYNIIREQPAIFHKYRNNVGTAGGTATADGFINIQLGGCTDGVNYNFGELQRPGCRLRDLAIHIGNVFWHFEQTYQRDPAGFARTYPNLVNSIANGVVPWGKPPFPLAPVATHWVPKLGTKPIKIFPVHGIKYRPLLPAAPAPAHAGTKVVVKVVTPTVAAHTRSFFPRLLSKLRFWRR
jgi:hypothetical protein